MLDRAPDHFSVTAILTLGVQAMRGRKPKPTALKAITGTLEKSRLNKREPKPVGDLFEPPEHLDDASRDVWSYAIANAPHGLLKRLDASVLEAWVYAYVLHRQAAQRVQTEGLTLQAPSGYLMPHPAISIANRAAQLMLKAAVELGFTPSARSRVSIATEPIAADDPWARLALDV